MVWVTPQKAGWRADNCSEIRCYMPVIHTEILKEPSND
jgi:hypothetical protein